MKTLSGKAFVLAILLATSLLTFRSLFLLPPSDWKFLESYDDDENFLRINVTQRPWSESIVNVVEPGSLAVKYYVCVSFGCDAWAFRSVAWALHTLAASVICLTAHPFSGFLFLVHPFAIEAVLWPSAFGYPLAVALCAVATALYIPYARKNQAYICTRVSFALTILIIHLFASFSKAPAVLWPLVFVAIAFLQETEAKKGEQVFLLPFCAKQLSLPLIQSLGLLCLCTTAAIILANEDGAKVDADTIQLNLTERLAKFAAVVAESAGGLFIVYCAMQKGRGNGGVGGDFTNHHLPRSTNSCTGLSSTALSC